VRGDRRVRRPRGGGVPIVGGAPIKGPADHLLRAIGSEVSARGVARLYRDLAGGFVLDRRDAEQTADIEALGLRARAVDTIMRDAAASETLARAALDLADALR
jgi:LPPG:FO 2-phospho-L-lactate transferase